VFRIGGVFLFTQVRYNLFSLGETFMQMNINCLVVIDTQVETTHPSIHPSYKTLANDKREHPICHCKEPREEDTTVRSHTGKQVAWKKTRCKGVPSPSGAPDGTEKALKCPRV
jgi:hypothetical protein